MHLSLMFLPAMIYLILGDLLVRHWSDRLLIVFAAVLLLAIVLPGGIYWRLFGNALDATSAVLVFALCFIGPEMGRRRHS